MKYSATLLATKDLKETLKFYIDLFECTIENDFGANVSLTNGICFQALESWQELISKKESEICCLNNAFEIYFESDDLDGFLSKLNARNDIVYVHPLIEHRWGQRVIRIYDPNGHIIEIGENMDHVVKRFMDSGLSIEDTAKRMDVSIEYIETAIKRLK